MPSPPKPRIAACLAGLSLSLALFGCARPGPPRAPSLHIPAVVTDLSASRTGEIVELRFTAPSRASDNVPLPPGMLRGVLCRQTSPAAAPGPAAPAPCVAVAGIDIVLAAKAGPQHMILQDPLPAPLATGPAHLLTYRVQFFSPNGRSLGESEPAYSVAGESPAPVAGLSLTGARNGVVLSWQPATPYTDEVLLERTDLAAAAAPSPRKPSVVAVPRRPARRATATPTPARTTAANVLWLQANADPGTGRTLDASLDADTPYQYRALRRRTVQLGGRTLELRSSISAPLPITLLQIYPPAAPTGLNVAAYFERFGTAQTSELAPTFAVDLVWQPIDDDTRTAPLAGYNIYREALDAKGTILTPATRLNPTPTLLPAFHDATAQPTQRYLYRVTAIDTKNNESPPATATLEPQVVSSK